MPVPTPTVLAALRARPTRAAECALSHAVDTAMAARPQAARPAALAAHVAVAMHARVRDDAWRCLPDEPEWLLNPGAARALEVNGTLDGLAETFIDCQWPTWYVR
jgi:hypothetical protein